MENYLNTMLISPNKVKAFGTINLNVDDTTIATAIRTAQNVYLVDVIGLECVQHLQQLVHNKITGSGTSIDEEEAYKDLLDDYITPCLVYRTAVELSTILTLKIRNMGVVKNSDINVNQTTSGELKYLADYYKTLYYDAVNKMVAFICENTKSFPDSKIECTCGSTPLYANSDLFLG